MTVTNGDVLKVFLELVLGDGTIAQNVFNLDCVFGDDQSDGVVSAAIEGYIESIYGELATYLSDDFTINPSWLHKIAWNPTQGKWLTTYLIDIFTPSFAHTNTDDAFPNQIAPVMTGNTYLPASRGRKFVMGFVETSALAGSLVTGAVVALVGAVAEYISNVVIDASNVMRPGVVDADSSAYLTFRDGVANTIVGTQRRRKPGVGS